MARDRRRRHRIAPCVQPNPHHLLYIYTQQTQVKAIPLAYHWASGLFLHNQPMQSSVSAIGSKNIEREPLYSDVNLGCWLDPVYLNYYVYWL